MYKQYTELCESIAKLVSEIHSNTIATNILQDPESFSWSDNKEFYEVCEITIDDGFTIVC